MLRARGRALRLGATPLQPRARKEGSEWVGWGMATGQWDAMQMFARAHAALHADGRLVVSSAASDIGTGTYTVMAMIAAEALGLPLEQVTFQLGDSTLPVAPIEGGSSHVTTVGSAVDGVCAKLRARLLRLAQALPESRFAKARTDDVVFADGKLALRADASSALALTDLLRTAGLEQIEDKFLLLPNVLQATQIHPCHARRRVCGGPGGRRTGHGASHPRGQRHCRRAHPQSDHRT